ncbi:MAG: type 1 glutamine amidotransferase [Pseudomonadota bacterium]
MTLTLLEVGQPRAALRRRFPDYPEMFEDLLTPHMPGLTVETVRISSGDAYPDPKKLNAVLITGSPFGVYDDLPWMAGLFDFIRWCAYEGVKQVGICFGHQAMAQAFGGQVIKSPKGWGIGRHRYQITAHQDWMGPEGDDSFALAVSHQDQVIEAPPGAEIIARSEFCPLAGLKYSQGPAVSFQGHPEFSDAFAAALYENRRGDPLGDEEVVAALASLSSSHDNERVGKWIADFLVI